MFLHTVKKQKQSFSRLTSFLHTPNVFLSLPPFLVRCLSGRKEQFAKLSYAKVYRGFESHPHRTSFRIAELSFRTEEKKREISSGCSVARYRVWFGTRRSQVRILPPRQVECRIKNVELRIGKPVHSIFNSAFCFQSEFGNHKSESKLGPVAQLDRAQVF